MALWRVQGHRFDTTGACGRFEASDQRWTERFDAVDRVAEKMNRERFEMAEKMNASLRQAVDGTRHGANQAAHAAICESLGKLDDRVTRLDDRVTKLATGPAPTPRPCTCASTP